ncbi:DNA cytosine methyltransferase [Acidithiobacillus ferrivorans]|nr:DNA cytosine methyltransferase [Acidithiobacillus ferrivorans]
MLTPQLILGISEEIVVDLFAGGGGMSTAIEQAIGRHVDVAVNHNAEAISMHQANHPQTTHYIGDVWEVDPREATESRAVGLVHLSSECTHHSQAAGGQPRNKSSRSLTWVGKRWAGQAMPRVITLENVKQILQWGPLIAKRDKATGRVLKLDGTVAEAGERVPLQEQYLIPDPKRTGKTWRAFVTQLRVMGYAVEWKILCAADFGAPTTRERLFMVARCDGEPIRWPEPTHTKIKTKGKKRWRSAAECIDWDIPCPSIFEREKPLADATMRRIARGLKKYVLDSADPFIIPIAHYNGRDACNYAVASAYLAQMNGGFNTTPGHDVRRPASTITNTGSQQQVVMAHLTHLRGNCDARDVEDPLMTISAGGQHHGVVSAFLSRQFGASVGHGADAPLGTVTAGGGGKSALVSAFLATNTTGHTGVGMDEPIPTLTTGQHQAQVECTLSPDDEASALRVAAFLIHYYGEGGQWGDPRNPMATITTNDRLALVTVHIEGTPYVIVDIGLRMLQPRELYRAQGFPESYIIDHGHDGRKFSKSAQVRMCGNSVSPPPAAALIRANYADARGRMVA